MNRLMQWVIAAALICSSTVFTSCMNDDNPVGPTDNLAEKLIGKWIIADMNGQAAPTNEKTVLTFLSATKATVSESKADYAGQAAKWSPAREYEVQIDGDKVTLTGHPTEINTIINEYTIISINDNEMFCALKHTVIRNDKIIKVTEMKLRFTRVSRDYSEQILGTWEGHATSSEGSEYDDGETHRWEYKADGTFVYYVQNDNGEWVPSSNTLNEYFVDGVLLATRWIDNDVENREWWEIVSIKDGVMKWKGLRQKEDGTTYTATFEMKKVE